VSSPPFTLRDRQLPASVLSGSWCCTFYRFRQQQVSGKSDQRIEIGMASTGRSSNVDAAVSFLRDPAVQDSPLNKKLEFLQAKGLTQEEIDAAFRIMSSAGTIPSSSSAPTLPPRQGTYGYAYPGPQDRMRPDWRDWFIMAVVGGSVGTLMYSIARVCTSTFSSLPGLHNQS
jgi:hypothetical protein